MTLRHVLLDCLRSESSIKQSIARSCRGVIFIGTPHTLEQAKLLRPMSPVTKVYPRSVLRMFINDSLPDFAALVNEMTSVNQDFRTNLVRMPYTFCVTNLRKKNDVFDTALPPEIRRHGRDKFLSVIEDINIWRHVLHKNHPVFISIMTNLREWAQTDEIAVLPAKALSTQQTTSSGVNLLSIDGGGVRGLASLLVMERIMQEIVKKEVAEDPSTSGILRIPADYFDLAGGTSTPGLICIMLFRLRMDIRSAIVEYRHLLPEIFKMSVSRYMGANIAKAVIGKPRFDGKTLEKVVKKIVRDRIPWEEKERLGNEAADARLNSNVDGVPETSCKTFLCALRKDDKSVVRFRAYAPVHRTEDAFADCKIWEAACAISAAPFYFPTALVQGVKFWDGGLANNNPVLEVLAEKSQLYPQRPVNSMISLGTGVSEREPSKSMMSAVDKGKQILKTVTDVHMNHMRAKEQLQADRIPYFRFNPSMAEDEIGIADFHMRDALERHTKRYLDQEDTKAQIDQCASLLYHRSKLPQPQQNSSAGSGSC